MVSEPGASVGSSCLSLPRVRPGARSCDSEYEFKCTSMIFYF